MSQPVNNDDHPQSFPHVVADLRAAEEQASFDRAMRAQEKFDLKMEGISRAIDALLTYGPILVGAWLTDYAPSKGWPMLACIGLFLLVGIGNRLDGISRTLKAKGGA
jgi:hypothetical protein